MELSGFDSFALRGTCRKSEFVAARLLFAHEAFNKGFSARQISNFLNRDRSTIVNMKSKYKPSEHYDKLKKEYDRGIMPILVRKAKGRALSLFNRASMYIKELIAKNSLKSKKKMRNLESSLQQGCIKWFNLTYPQHYGLLFSIPNGGNRNIVTAVRLKAEGTITGVSDLILLIPTEKYNGLCIEMKYGRGKQTENQIWWERKVEAQGYRYEVCNSIESFIDTIKTYLNGI